ncbi:hypothetical protein JTB14_015567 [Gonioctena quinquepunctata]|nr:hypothetical protein JTB14_015567 [Gonioctena quinquepunctata]
MEANTEQKCNKYMNLIDKNENTSTIQEPAEIPPKSSFSNGNWNLVMEKRPKRPKLIGTNSTITLNGREVRGVPRLVKLHVYRVHPSLTKTDLTQLTKGHSPEAQCEALNSKHPEIYASFKVTIYEGNFEAAMEPMSRSFGT